MKAVILVVLLLMMGPPLTAQDKNYTWVSIMHDKANGQTHELAENSIALSRKNIYTFVYRITFAPPKKLQDGNFVTSLVSINGVDCSTRETVIIKDAALNGDKVVGIDIVAPFDSSSVAPPGTPHHAIVKKICGPTKQDAQRSV